jgi:hypothetical protein
MSDLSSMLLGISNIPLSLTQNRQIADITKCGSTR